MLGTVRISSHLLKPPIRISISEKYRQIKRVPVSRICGWWLTRKGCPTSRSKSMLSQSIRAGTHSGTRMYHFYAYNEEWFKAHYRNRSNVEMTFCMIKEKFGTRLLSKTEIAQFNEVLCKVLCHNICVIVQSMYELGIEPVVWND